MRGLIWIASYPKSGNTWTRAFFSHYLDVEEVDNAHFNPSIDSLYGGALAVERTLFDDLLCVSSSELSPQQVEQLRFVFHRELAKEFMVERPNLPPLVKTHECFNRANGMAGFRSPETAGAIVLVRDPLDVSVSYANHLGWNIDRTIHSMSNDWAQLGVTKNGINSQFPELMRSWSTHVLSWTEQYDIPVLVVRYEDLLENPIQNFRTMLEFTGCEVNDIQLSISVKATQFDQLSTLEKKYKELKITNTSKVFYRKGIRGDWRNVLSHNQAKQIISDNKPVMNKFGYLQSALDWLAQTESDAQSSN